MNSTNITGDLGGESSEIQLTDEHVAKMTVEPKGGKAARAHDVALADDAQRGQSL